MAARDGNKFNEKAPEHIGARSGAKPGCLQQGC